MTLPFTLKLRYNMLEVPEQVMDGILLDACECISRTVVAVLLCMKLHQS